MVYPRTGWGKRTRYIFEARQGMVGRALQQYNHVRVPRRESGLKVTYSTHEIARLALQKASVRLCPLVYHTRAPFPEHTQERIRLTTASTSSFVSTTLH